MDSTLCLIVRLVGLPLVLTCTLRRGWDYPIHLGVTEAGEGEDGRMKSAIGIGALLMDGIGDTIRVSLTEDPEFELEPCVTLAEVSDYRQSCWDPSRHAELILALTRFLCLPAL